MVKHEDVITLNIISINNPFEEERAHYLMISNFYTYSLHGCPGNASEHIASIPLSLSIINPLRDVSKELMVTKIINYIIYLKDNPLYSIIENSIKQIIEKGEFIFEGGRFKINEIDIDHEIRLEDKTYAISTLEWKSTFRRN